MELVSQKEHFWICMRDLLEILREKKTISHLERQQWKEQIMEMGHALQQYVMPEGVSKKRPRAGNIMTWLWMKQPAHPLGQKANASLFQSKRRQMQQELKGITSYTLCKALSSVLRP